MYLIIVNSFKLLHCRVYPSCLLDARRYVVGSGTDVCVIVYEFVYS